MAFQINGTDVIDNNGDLDNIVPPLDPNVWESMFSAQSSWNTDDFTVKSGSSSQTIDLKQQGVWPTTNDFRELFFEVKLTSIPSSGTYGFSSPGVLFQQGTSAVGYDARAVLCPFQASFVNLTNRPDQGMYLHLINRRENFSVPTYSASAYYIADDTSGIGNLRNPGFSTTSKNIDWESTFAGQTDRIYILFPSFATSSVSWKITCRWR